MEKKPKNILLTDDHFVVRQGLKMLIAFFYPTYKVYQASDLQEAHKILSQHEIDLLILDATFPEGSSLSEIKNLKATAPDIKILLYTALDEHIHGPLYLNAGADGFLSKLAEESEIKIAIQDMLEIGSYMNRSLKDKIVHAFLRKEPINPLQKLSEQEMQVMQLLVKGMGNLEICNQLNLKPTTITTYKNRLFEKLSVKNLPELIEIINLYHG